MPVGVDRILPLYLFSDLPIGELVLVAKAADEREMRAGDVVASADDFGHALYAIEAGEVDIVKDGVAIRRLGHGDIFGEIALVRSGRRTASVVAATDCRLLRWFKRDVWGLEKSAPAFARVLRASADAHLAADDVV